MKIFLIVGLLLFIKNQQPIDYPLLPEYKNTNISICNKNCIQNPDTKTNGICLYNIFNNSGVEGYRVTNWEPGVCICKYFFYFFGFPGKFAN
jgi:hypothetical protein